MEVRHLGAVAVALFSLAAAPLAGAQESSSAAAEQTATAEPPAESSTTATEYNEPIYSEQTTSAEPAPEASGDTTAETTPASEATTEAASSDTAVETPATGEPVADPAATDAGAPTIDVESVRGESVNLETSEPTQVSGAQALDTVEVTSSYRKEDIQDVIGGAQVFGGKTLDRQGAKGMEDYLRQVPSVSLQKGGNGSSQIAMRGISNVNGNDLGYADGSPTVGIYFNDVAIQGSGTFPDLNLFDLRRIEVLQGPQGTLYGEGSMGGSIKMVMMEPEPNQWQARVSGLYGVTSDGAPSHDLRGALNIPLIEDTLAARIVATQRTTGGYVDYTTLGREDANEENAHSLRGIANWQALDNLELEYLYFLDSSEREQFPVVEEGQQEALTNPREEDQFADTKFDIHALTARWQLSFANLTSVSAVYNTQKDSRRRTPVLQSLLETQVRNTPITLPDFFSNASTHVTTDLESFSQELRLVSFGGETFDWIGGLFYRDRSQGFEQEKREDTVPDDPTGLLNLLLGSFNPVSGRQEQGDGDERYEQYAVFGEVKWNIVPAVFDITAGLRYFSEDIGFDFDTTFYGLEAFLLATDPANVEPGQGSLLAVKKTITEQLNYKDFLPKLAASWHVTEDHMLYATIARGFRSGTPNIYAALGAGPPVVRPDFVWNYEVGAKLSWFDGALITNFSAYHIDWEDMQGTLVGQAMLGIVPVDFAYMGNGGDSVVRGAEASIMWAPVQRLLLTLNGGYNTGKVTKPAAESGVSQDAEVPNKPKLTWTGGFSYGLPLWEGAELDLNASYSFIDSQKLAFFTPEVDGDPEFANELTIDSYSLIKAGIGLQMDKLRIQLLGDNLADKRWVVAKSSPIPQYTVITPRTLSVQLSYDF